MSIFLSEEVLKYREFETDVAIEIIHKILNSTDEKDFQFNCGALSAIKRFINLPKTIASTPEEQVYAKELIGKTKDLLANKIAGKYIFE
jgi:hypothetical protein